MNNALYVVTCTENGDFYAWERVDSFWRRKFLGYHCIGGPFFSNKEAWKKINRFDASDTVFPTYKTSHIF